MMPMVITLCLVGTILITTIIAGVTIQQRRLLRTRSTFAGRLLTAQDRERAAIARELHDDLVQRLVHVSHQLRAGAPGLATRQAETVDGVVTGLRQMAHGMHPTAVDHQDLGSALQTLANGISVPSHFEVAVESLGDLSALDRPGRLTLYRVAQEAIRNAQEHAGSRRVAVTVERLPSEVRLMVRDWGAGFEVGQESDRIGLGLLSMEERMKLLRGRLEIASEPGAGTTVTAVLPVPGSR